MRNTNILVIFLLIVFTINFSSAMLGTFKTNECVDIRVLANCSSMNLTEINNGVQTFVINSPMTHLGGQTFNYSFCNTSTNGDYSYSWNNPCVDCATQDCGNSFGVTPNGQILDISTSILFGFIFLIIIGFLLLSIYGLNNAVKAEWQIGYICSTFLMLFSLFFVAWLFSSYYLWQTPILASIFWIIWLILSIIFWPFIILIGGYLLKSQAEAMMEQRLTSEGYSPEDSHSMARNH